MSRVVSVLSAEQADRRDAQAGSLLQEQPKGTWSRSWDKLHRHLMPNALWLLPGSSVEARGQSRAPQAEGTQAAAHGWGWQLSTTRLSRRLCRRQASPPAALM